MEDGKYYLYLVDHERRQVVRLQFDSENARDKGHYAALYSIENPLFDCMTFAPVNTQDYAWFDEERNPIEPEQE